MSRASLFLQMYYSVMDDIRFHQSQLNYLEQRARQLQNNIINLYVDNPAPTSQSYFMNSLNNSSLFSRNRRRQRQAPTSAEETKIEVEIEPDSEPTQETERSSSSQLRNIINSIIQSSSVNSTSSVSSFPFLSSTNRVSSTLSPFTYIGTFDATLDEDSNSNSYARNLLSGNPLRTTTSSIPETGMLMYYILESIDHLDNSNEQHGIENPTSYITDMIFKDVEQPANTCCPIRMDVFTDETEITQINKCKHLFCRQEIRRWLETHHTCPLCRTAIDN